MRLKVQTCILSLILAGVAPASWSESPSTAADDAARNYAGPSRAIPGENEIRGGDDPEITANSNTARAERDEGVLHPEQDSNFDSKPGTGSASTSGAYSSSTPPVVNQNPMTTKDSGTTIQNEPAKKKHWWNLRHRDTKPDMTRSNIDSRSRVSGTNETYISSDYGNDSSSNDRSISRSDADYGRDYNSGNGVGVRSFAAQKDPNFKVADYGSGSRYTERYTGTFKNPNAGGRNEDVAVASKSEKSATDRSNRTPVRSSSGRVNLSEESERAALSSSNSTDSSAKSEEATKQPDAEKRTAHGDMAFAGKAAQGNAIEIAMAKLGAERATDPRVRDFANRLINDHEKANEKLLGLDITRSPKINLQQNELNQKAEDMLKGKSGAEFDKHFIEHMLRDHAKAARDYREASMDLKDSALKNYARDTLPVIQEHLRVAQQLDAELSGEKPAKPDISEKQ